MPWLMGIISGGLGNRAQTFPGTSSGTSSTSINPTLDPLASSGYNDIITKYQNLLSSDPDLKGYQASESSNINKLAGVQKENTVESMAARGITTGPAVSTAANSVENNRINQQIGLSNSIPILSRQLTENTLNGYLNAVKSLPVGTSSNQTSNSTTTSTVPGQVGAGVTGALANIPTNVWKQALNILGLGGGGSPRDPNADISAMKDYLGNKGIDVSNLSDDEIRAIINGIDLSGFGTGASDNFGAAGRPQ
jgi:hypothetical protein